MPQPCPLVQESVDPPAVECLLVLLDQLWALVVQGRKALVLLASLPLDFLLVDHLASQAEEVDLVSDTVAKADFTIANCMTAGFQPPPGFGGPGGPREYPFSL